MTLPNRASDAGPEPQAEQYDWRDYLDFAGDSIRRASREETLCSWSAEARNAKRIVAINAAIADLERAKGLLC